MAITVGPDVFYLTGGASSGGSAHLSQYSLTGELLGRSTDDRINGVGGAVDPKTGNPFWTNFSNHTILTCPSTPDANKVLGPVEVWLNVRQGNAESMVFRGDRVLVGYADAGNGIVDEYDYNTKALTATYNVGRDNRGTDWIALANDDNTLIYSGEGTRVLRYDLAARQQLADFATGVWGTCYSVLARQSNGEVLITGRSGSVGGVKRYDADGLLIREYLPSPSPFGFAAGLNFAEDTLFIGDFQSSRFWIIDIETGAGLDQPLDQPGNFQTGGVFSLGGTQLVPTVLGVRSRVAFTRGR